MKWRRNKSRGKRWNRNHLVLRDGSNCAICLKPFKDKRHITIDHVIPLSKGGADTIDNMQLAHYRCNRLKDNMTPEEFIEYQGA